ncbi:MAG: S9 family peptidase [Bdellovibrionales bacterium]|nr:S9 family peptidase [Bdellovibrionales bacterium]
MKHVRRRLHRNLSSFLFLAVNFAGLGGAVAAGPDEPKAPMHAFSVKVGTRTISDPYHWMETLWGQPLQPELRTYIDEENAFSREYFSKVSSLRDRLLTEMRARAFQPISAEVSSPTRDYVYEVDAQNEDFPRLIRRKDSGAQETVFDTAEVFSDQEGYASIDAWEPSPDDSKVFVFATLNGISRHFVKEMSGRGEMREFDWDVANKDWTKAVVWSADSLSFLYTKNSVLMNRGSIRLRRWNDWNSGDAVVFSRENDERSYLSLTKTSDAKYARIQVVSYAYQDTFLVPIDGFTSRPIEVLPHGNLWFTDVDHDRDRFIVMTNQGSRVHSIFAVPDRAAKNEVVLGKSNCVIRGSIRNPIEWHYGYEMPVYAFRDFFVVVRRFKSNPYLELYSKDFQLLRKIRFAGAHFDLNVLPNQPYGSDSVLVKRVGLLVPETLYRVTLGGASEIERTKDAAASETYREEKIFYPARDGTKIPLTLVYRPKFGERSWRDLRNRKIYLEGYGSYGSNFHIDYDNGWNRAYALSLIDRGFVVAIAHIRGGAENGFDWWLQTRGAGREKVFHDFISAAEFLIARKTTRAKDIAIQGYSAGGLLIGNVLNLRPDLFRAAIINAPYLDAIHTEMDGRIPQAALEWDLWGNPNLPRDLEMMWPYAPYEQISRQVYPSILVNTALDDWNVLFHESTKYVARLRSCRVGRTPLYLNVLSSDVGDHDGTYGKHEEDWARNFAFVLDAFGIEK